MAKRKVWIDTETFSSVPIEHGTYKYVEKVELLIVTWAVEDGPVMLWDAVSEPRVPLGLKVLLENPDAVFGCITLILTGWYSTLRYAGNWVLSYQ